MNKNYCQRANKPCRTEKEAEVKAFQKGMRSYRCEFCEAFHLTSKSKKQRMPERFREEEDYG